MIKKIPFHFILFGVPVILFLLFMLFMFMPADPFDLTAVKVEVKAGSSARAAQMVLQAGGILPRFSFFLPAVKLLGAQDKIKAGEYYFSPSDPLPRVIVKLLRGETIPPREIKVTFPEGTSIYKMGMILKEKGFKRWSGFQGLAEEGITAPFRERHRLIFRYISSESLEGYLFPDSYQFLMDASEEAMAEIMVRRFETVVLPFWEKANKNAGFSLHEILTLASIIEKEAKMPRERTIISSVFYNRLKLGMPLAADPTIKYALERPSKKVYLDQLSVRSPYNTYKRKGLPPGPICNPGIESIKAAVYPAKTNYLFFVAKADGTHIFSKTWEAHLRAKRTIPTQ